MYLGDFTGKPTVEEIVDKIKEIDDVRMKLIPWDELAKKEDSNCDLFENVDIFLQDYIHMLYRLKVDMLDL